MTFGSMVAGVSGMETSAAVSSWGNFSGDADMKSVLYRFRRRRPRSARRPEVRVKVAAF